MAAREIGTKKYIVNLSEAERNHLQALINKGKSPAKRLLKARILLKADAGAQGENWSDGAIIEALDTNKSMVTRVRQQFVEESLEAVLSRRACGACDHAHFRRRERGPARGAGLLDAPRRPCALDAAASGRQGGGTRHRRARQRQHDRARSEKNTLQPHRKEQWVIPPEANGAFVAAMEEVLDVYTRPHDPEMPLVCLDETSKQLVSETRTPVPMKPGQPERIDYEYERNGTANLFMLFAPLEGFRHVEVTDHRKAVDYAKILKDLSDVLFPHARKIALVQDNLNTHVKASLYEAFPPAEARRLAERFEWHYTPKHGSWLNMAESELGVLSSQCLNRRIPDKETLSREVAAWQASRNKNQTKADWRFTTADARIKLKCLYPRFE